MMNYEKFIARHGEYGVQAIVERIERYDGVKANDNLTLEQRWNALMQSTGKAA